MVKQIAAVLLLTVAASVYSSFSGNGPSTLNSLRVASKPAEIPEAAPGADPDAPRKVKNNVIAYKIGDPKLEAAKRKAKSTLARFSRMLEEGDSGTYTVKFPLTQNGATEHIWLQVDRTNSEGTGFVGRLANEPVNGSDYKVGDRLEVAKADIEDWMVNQGDAIYGGYSARIMMDQMPEAERSQYEKLFKD